MSEKVTQNNLTIPDLYNPFIKYKKGADNYVFTGGRPHESLNGLWHYAVDWYNTCLRSHWYEEIREDKNGNLFPLDYSFDQWKTISLPCCWNLVKPEYYYYESSMVFTRTFYFRRKADTKERLILRIGAANYLCTVFINQKPAAFHEGGSTPFFADITDFAKDGDNRIILVVDAARSEKYVPMNNTDWFPYGGVYRDIDLFRVPEIFIRDFQCALVPGSDFHDILANVTVSSNVDGVAIFEIPELRILTEFEVKNGKGTVRVHADPELWSPDHPKLYNVKLTFLPSVAADSYDKALKPYFRNSQSLGEKVKSADTVSDRIGFREISIHNHDVYLNGQKIFLKGISCHEDSDEHGKALTREDRLTILREAKNLNCNYIRLAHYPHHEEMAKLADEAGMLLWEEIPVYWAIDFSNMNTLNNAKNQLEEMIKRDFNRASVIIWSVGNENLDTNDRFRFMSHLANRARMLDPTRKISAACLVSKDFTIRDRLAESIDIIGINEYCGWYIPDFTLLRKLFSNSHPEKPVIISEFGADARSGHHGTIDEKFTEECQADIYRRQIEEIRQTSYICGMSPWLLFDFRCPRRTSYIQNYYNLKGLVSSDRKHRKQAFYVLQDFYHSLEITLPDQKK